MMNQVSWQLFLLNSVTRSFCHRLYSFRELFTIYKYNSGGGGGGYKGVWGPGKLVHWTSVRGHGRHGDGPRDRSTTEDITIFI